MASIDVTFTTHDGNLLVLPIIATQNIREAKGFVTEALGLSAATHQFLHDGKVLDEARTFQSYGITSGELVLVEPKRDQAPPSRAAVTSGKIDFGSLKGPGQLPMYKSGATEQELRRFHLSIMSNSHFLQQIEGSDATLAARLKRGDLHAVDEILVKQAEARQAAEKVQRELEETLRRDPTNKEALEKMEDIKNKNAIQENMELAMEHTPEVFGSVVMLYINCKINGIECKAFVDSGAQMTIMNESLAKRCSLFHLLDKRYAGMAEGVGTSRILGRVHTANLEINGVFLPTSLTCLEGQSLELLIGLDMLRRHQCCIDLKHNVLRIETGGTQTPFLPESEFPEWASHTRQQQRDKEALEKAKEEKE